MKQTIIIRDCDLNKILYRSIKNKLFDTVETEPLTYSELQHENLMLMLSGKDAPEHKALPDLGHELLFRDKRLYDRRYLNWYLTMDYPSGQIYVQSRAGIPREPLLLVTFENNTNAQDYHKN